MTRPRRAYATAQGDTLLIAVVPLLTIRTWYSQNGGPVYPRHKRFLQRFLLPYSFGNGVSSLFALTVPGNVISTSPDAIRAVLEPHFMPITSAILEANPWLGDEQYALDYASIDSEMGGELEDHEHPWNWDHPESTDE